MLKGCYRRDTCRAKTERGNVHQHKRTAKKHANRMRREYGAAVVSYRCRVCQNWHVGGQRPADEVARLMRLAATP